MTLPALHAGKHIAASLNAVGSDFGFGRNSDWGSRFLVCPARRKMLYPGNEVSALLLGKGAPLWHLGAVHAASDGVENILVGRQGPARSGAALKYAQLEIAGLGVNRWIDPGGDF